MPSLVDDRVNRSIDSTIERAHFGRDWGSFFLKSPSFAGVHGNMTVALGLDPGVVNEPARGIGEHS